MGTIQGAAETQSRPFSAATSASEDVAFPVAGGPVTATARWIQLPSKKRLPASRGTSAGPVGPAGWKVQHVQPTQDWTFRLPGGALPCSTTAISSSGSRCDTRRPIPGP